MSNAKSGTNSLRQTRDTQRNHIKLSYEFFPPKNDKMDRDLWAAIHKLEAFDPDFVSVTYGAGGSTRERTHRTVTRIAKDTRLLPAAHLTCIGSDRSEIEDIANTYWEDGVRHIVALRGDPPEGIDRSYSPLAAGFAYSSDLVAGLKALHDFEISVSAYPERHPESPSWDIEIDNLKKKVDAGATRAITQFFFSADTLMRFQDRVLDAGIIIPIVPGIMLQPNFAGLKRMSHMCGVEVPDWYAEHFDGLEDFPEKREFQTGRLASELTVELRDKGVQHFHLYTLNRAKLASRISRVLGLHDNIEKDSLNDDLG